MSVTFCPNVGSVDLQSLAALDRNVFWDGIDEFQLYRDHFLVEQDYRNCVGLNTWPRIRKSGLCLAANKSKTPLVVEMGAVKEWDYDGDVLRNEFLAIRQRVSDAGGVLAAVVIDEPLVSGVHGQFSRPACFNHTKVHEVAQATADFVRQVTAFGVSSYLIQAWPRHPMDRIAAFIRHIHVDEGAKLSRVILDIDPYAPGASLQPERIAGMEDMKVILDRLGIEMGYIVTGHRILSESDYARKALASFREWLSVDDRAPWVSLQSWQELNGKKDVPVNMPPSGQTSHLGILRQMRVAV